MRILHLRHFFLLGFILLTIAFKYVPELGCIYTFHIYPGIAFALSHVSNIVPFAIGDIFISVSIIWVIVYPIYAIFIKKKKKLPVFLHVAEYLLWIYAWFYVAWGLNYSQPNIYRRLCMQPVEVQDSTFRAFAYRYADSLNAAYLTASKHINMADVSDSRSNHSHTTTLSAIKRITQQSVLHGYESLNNMGINRPFNSQAHAKTMIFSSLSSMAGITGSMGPFFCEFTLNANVLPHEYPATYAHEYAHFLGIANEGEANFYSYIVCTSLSYPSVRFSGYYQIFFHVLRNVRYLLGETEYKKFIGHIRPEIIRLAKSDRQYWLSRRSPIVDSTQSFFYDLYLKGNHVEGGMKSYSGVIGIIMAWDSVVD